MNLSLELDKELAQKAKAGGVVYFVLYLIALGSTELFSDNAGLKAGLALGFLLIAAGRIYVSHVFNQSEGVEKKKRVIKVFCALILLNSLTWGSFAGYLGFKMGLNPMSLLVLFCTGGIAGGSGASLGANLWLLRTHLLMLILPLTSGLALHGGANPHAISLSLVVFLGYLFIQAKATHLSIIEKFQQNYDLDTAREKLEQALKIKSEFFATISHEIRTPMNGIIGMTNLLLERKQDSESQSLAYTVKECAENLLTVINDILDYSKLESGKFELEYQPFLLKNSIESSMVLLEDRAEKKGLNLTYDIADGVPSAIIGDETRVHQILVNFFSNAVKFTEKGSVHLSVSATDHDHEKKLQFSVKDEGIGISPDRMDRLFKSFSQVDASTARKYGGTGLGLSICKSLAENMGGEVWVDSEEGVGSTFSFTILGKEVDPAKVPNRATKEVKLDSSFAEKHPLTILVAEDNQVNQRLILSLLKKMGYQADIAGNGLEAVKALELKSYDLILMDIQMPEMSGVEATEAIIRRWGSQRPKIIALTANAMIGDREKYLEAGLDDYLSKPIKVSKLVETIQITERRFGENSQGELNETVVETLKPQKTTQEAQNFNFQEMLTALGDDFELAKIFAKEFLDIYSKQMDAILESIDKHDFETLEREAHTMKGLLATLYASQGVTLALELENMGRRKELKNAKKILKDLSPLVEEIVTELHQIFEIQHSA